MEAASHKRASLMKSKLVMSFYRAGKPPAVATVKPRPALLVKTVSFRHDDGEGGFGKSDDGYSHGPNGGGGDEHVDNRATSYISQFKQRLILEESNLNNCTK